MLKNPKARKLVGIFLLFWAIFNFPIVSIFLTPGMIAGIPKMYILIFSSWLLMIGSLIFMLETAHKSRDV